MKIYLVLALWLAFAGNTLAQSVPESLQDNHSEANVPPEDVFFAYLERDVLAYLKAETSPSIETVETTLLRQEPTQSGLAYPKFYLWVVATSKDGAVIEGAARAAAVDRVGFEITTFLSVNEINTDPQFLASTFPALLVPDIVSRASIK